MLHQQLSKDSQEAQAAVEQEKQAILLHRKEASDREAKLALETEVFDVGCHLPAEEERFLLLYERTKAHLLQPDITNRRAKRDFIRAFEAIADRLKKNKEKTAETSDEIDKVRKLKSDFRFAIALYRSAEMARLRQASVTAVDSQRAEEAKRQAAILKSVSNSAVEDLNLLNDLPQVDESQRKAIFSILEKHMQLEEERKAIRQVLQSRVVRRRLFNGVDQQEPFDQLLFPSSLQSSSSSRSSASSPVISMRNLIRALLTDSPEGFSESRRSSRSSSPEKRSQSPEKRGQSPAKSSPSSSPSKVPLTRQASAHVLGQLTMQPATDLAERLKQMNMEFTIWIVEDNTIIARILRKAIEQIDIYYQPEDFSDPVLIGKPRIMPEIGSVKDAEEERTRLSLVRDNPATLVIQDNSLEKQTVGNDAVISLIHDKNRFRGLFLAKSNDSISKFGTKEQRDSHYAGFTGDDCEPYDKGSEVSAEEDKNGRETRKELTSEQLAMAINILFSHLGFSAKVRKPAVINAPKSPTVSDEKGGPHPTKLDSDQVRPPLKDEKETVASLDHAVLSISTKDSADQKTQSKYTVTLSPISDRIPLFPKVLTSSVSAIELGASPRLEGKDSLPEERPQSMQQARKGSLPASWENNNYSDSESESDSDNTYKISPPGKTANSLSLSPAATASLPFSPGLSSMCDSSPPSSENENKEVVVIIHNSSKKNHSHDPTHLSSSGLKTGQDSKPVKKKHWISTLFACCWQEETAAETTAKAKSSVVLPQKKSFRRVPGAS